MTSLAVTIRSGQCLQTGKVLPRSFLRRGTQPPLQPVQRLFEGEASYFSDHIASSGFDDSPVSIHLDPECGNDRCVFESLQIVVYALHRSQQLLSFPHFASPEAVQGHASEFADGIEQSQNIAPIVRLQFGNCRDALSLCEGSKSHRLDVFLKRDDNSWMALELRKVV